MCENMRENMGKIWVKIPGSPEDAPWTLKKRDAKKNTKKNTKNAFPKIPQVALLQYP